MTRYIDPDRAQFEAFKALDRDAPLNMLNLVQLNDLANYPGDHILARDGLTGAEAYATYGKHTAPLLAGVGGSIVWRGSFDMTFIGPAEETWDACFIAAYPNAHAFLEMIMSADYQNAVVHRQAAVKTSRLIRTSPLPGQDSFG